MYRPSGILGTPLEPPIDKIYPGKEPVVLSRFPRRLGPVTVSGNCQMQLFFSHPTPPMVRGHASAIWDPGDPHWSPQTTIFTPKTSPLSLAAFQKGKDQLYSLETAKYTFSSLTGEVGFFGGSDGGPQGPRWPMHQPLPWEVG